MTGHQDIVFEIQAAMVSRSRIDAGLAYAERALDEIERLRAALKEIVDTPDSCCLIAEAALDDRHWLDEQEALK